MTEIILHLTSGKGPDECRWMVAQLSRAFTREALKDGVVCEVIDSEEELPASLLLSVTGDQAEAFVSARVGTIQWIGESPFRPRHKRRNWFVGVNIAPSPDAMPDLRDEDIVFQTMRASGPGGQHVNKTDSAVRATHKPTGLIVTAQEQRSQHANRKLARQKLAALLDAQREKAGDNARQAQWSTHQNLERGKAVRTYTGPLFALKSPR
ncbi:peptide chain release factor H [Asticcacaulis sp. DW145]|uniref:Peptide chain release factor H n=2 Tax=Asticcacaulis currens TaxID=2984210 RepID=A0ABT5ID94_9CAUL|nr:peptide chain release factor H [Asticcacaulis currens]MDC7694155.1 peptide chain release factor H [Asticcacaulis currens]BEV09888.1 peptide chain release factor H [Asticcacaulis sp. DW145]